MIGPGLLRLFTFSPKGIAYRPVKIGAGRFTRLETALSMPKPFLVHRDVQVFGE